MTRSSTSRRTSTSHGSAWQSSRACPRSSVHLAFVETLVAAGTTSPTSSASSAAVAAGRCCPLPRCATPTTHLSRVVRATPAALVRASVRQACSKLTPWYRVQPALPLARDRLAAGRGVDFGRVPRHLRPGQAFHRDHAARLRPGCPQGQGKLQCGYERLVIRKVRLTRLSICMGVTDPPSHQAQAWQGWSLRRQRARQDSPGRVNTTCYLIRG